MTYDSFSKPFIFRSNVINIDDFKATTLVWDEGHYPTFSQGVLVAREFALLYHDKVLVLPQTDRPVPRIWIIRPKTQVTGTLISPVIRPLEERIIAHGLRVGKDYDHVDPEVLEESLQFCIQARISPLWNRVGRYFMQGRLFVRYEQHFAVQPELRMDSDLRLTLTLRGGQLKHPFCKLEDFEIDPLVLQRFYQNISDTIPGNYIGRKLVIVMPNLTRANLFSITKVHLNSEAINCWKNMKRYWKNMYGFRLSDVEEGDEPDCYFNVTFGTKKDMILSYPYWCVRPILPFPVPRIDPVPVVHKFVEDLSGRVMIRGKIKSFCGYKLQFDFEDGDKAPISKLETASSGDSSFLVCPDIGSDWTKREDFGIYDTTSTPSINIPDRSGDNRVFLAARSVRPDEKTTHPIKPIFLPSVKSSKVLKNFPVKKQRFVPTFKPISKKKI